MKIAIVGSRTYPNLKQVADFVADLPEGTIVISGGAIGVDRTAENAAKARGLQVISIKPSWGKYGRQAGFLRNTQIVEMADEIVAFWDGESRGTKDSIDKAMKLGKSVTIFSNTICYP